MPSLFGTPGKPVSVGYVVRSMVERVRLPRLRDAGRSIAPARSRRGCARSPPTRTKQCGGKGVGAVGMCFTGGFALGMMLDERMLAPVLSQPSLPFSVGKKRKAAVGISDADLEVVDARGQRRAPA